jgi:acyl dehydratase
MAASEHIDVGHELPPLRLAVSGEQVKRYALAADMPGGRFMGDEEARREGLPGQIVPGNLSMALFSRLIGTAFPGATLLRLSATFRGLVRPGVALLVHGVVTEQHAAEAGTIIECDLVLESPEGERWVTGTASVQLPPG